MKTTDLKDVLALVKAKLRHEPEAACGIFWADEPPITTYYAVGEEDAEPTSRYAVGEEDATSLYSMGEED